MEEPIKKIDGGWYPRRRILVMAIARSGHHAVTHWICANMEGRVAHYNNCNHLLHWRDKVVYMNSRILNTAVVCSFENFDLRGFKELQLNNKFTHIVFVNRDPYNLFASSLAKGTGKGLSLVDKTFRPSQKRVKYTQYHCGTMTRQDMFVQYTKQCLGEIDLVGEPIIDINYNRWFAEKAYRMEICDKLGMNHGDRGRDHVSPRGGGSSFDKARFRGKGTKMDVLNRWQNFVDDEKFNRLLTDEIKEYSRKYFNFNPM